MKCILKFQYLIKKMLYIVKNIVPFQELKELIKNTLKVSSDNHDIVIINAPQIGVFVEE